MGKKKKQDTKSKSGNQTFMISFLKEKPGVL